MAFHVRDPETDALVRRLAKKEGVGLTEAVKLAVQAKLNDASRVPLGEKLKKIAEEHVRAALRVSEIEVIAITDEVGRAALDAFERYGKGRGHPAQLNMGDCFAYGAARTMAVPLLYKGNDFAETDSA